MLVAVGQISIAWENKAENLRKISALLPKAKAQGAELVLFPEMSLTGFSMNISRTAEEEPETLRAVSRAAAEYGVAVGIGWVKRRGEKAENHYSLVGEDGALLMDYAKLHPFSFAGEDRFFVPGEEICFCRLKGRALSAAICYDLRFPEIFQIMSWEAEIILVPANWPEPRREHWRTLLKARAIETQSYVIGINCVGNMGGSTYAGDSAAVSPDGKVLGCIRETEGLLYIDIPDDVQRRREAFPIKQDRRERFYQEAYRRAERTQHHNHAD